MKLTIIAVTLIAVSAAAAAIAISVYKKNEVFVVILKEDDGSTLSIKKSSVKVENDRIGAIVQYIYFKHDTDLSIQKVSFEDCKKGYGKFSVYYLNGEPKGDNEFVLGASNLYSTTAGYLCKVLLKRQ